MAGIIVEATFGLATVTIVGNDVALAHEEVGALPDVGPDSRFKEEDVVELRVVRFVKEVGQGICLYGGKGPGRRVADVICRVSVR